MCKGYCKTKFQIRHLKNVNKYNSETNWMGYLFYIMITCPCFFPLMSFSKKRFKKMSVIFIYNGKIETGELYIWRMGTN